MAKQLGGNMALTRPQPQPEPDPTGASEFTKAVDAQYRTRQSNCGAFTQASARRSIASTGQSSPRDRR